MKKELKTLEDIENELLRTKKDFSFVFGFIQLKAEAIKRYIFFTRKMNQYSSKSDNWFYFKGKCDELVENFNLTEEDLK